MNRQERSWRRLAAVLVAMATALAAAGVASSRSEGRLAFLLITLMVTIAGCCAGAAYGSSVNRRRSRIAEQKSLAPGLGSAAISLAGIVGILLSKRFFENAAYLEVLVFGLYFFGATMGVLKVPDNGRVNIGDM